MEENQNQQQTYGDQQQTYGQQSQQTYGDQQQTYGNPGNYGQPNYNNLPVYYNNGGFGNPQIQHGPVTDIFCYLLLVIMPLRQIISMISIKTTFGALDISYSSLMNGSYMSSIYTPGYMVISVLSWILTICFIVFMVLDIVKIYKQHYKITGLILFAIFLSPGYYIWRAYVLGRKKTIPIIYTVCYSILVVAAIIYSFYMSFSLSMSIFDMMM